MSNRSIHRREFLIGLGITGASTLLLPHQVLGALPHGFGSPVPLYPPMDLSYFDRPVTPAPADIRFGYASITWNGDDLQAIKDISEVGFRGIQLRANILKDYGAKPGALRDLLAGYNLELVALSSGGVHLSPGKEEDEITLHTRNAKFLADAGGRYLQVTDAGRPQGAAPTAESFKRLGNLLSEIGRRVTDMGVRLGYHNHMGTMGQAPEEVDKIMAEADPAYVKLELDIAHYFQGGGDPALAIRAYRDRLLFLHLKDVERMPTAPGGYRFVELGRGQVNVPEVFAALKQVAFRGWAVIELDSVPDDERSKGLTPKQCMIQNKKYLEERIGATI
jgi:inosose dehydratase